MKETEIWKDIPEYEGLYQVSNWGRVKSLNYKHSGKEGILKPDKKKNGYLYVNFLKNGEVKNFYIHKLVCLTFLENPLNLPQVNHKDENKENNFVDNLEWVSPKENINYGTANERRSKSHKGKKLLEETKRKLSEANKGKGVKPILQFTLEGIFIREWDSVTTASKELNISKGNITLCCQGKRNKCSGYIWRYKE